jgi:hypothetical protein
MAMFGRSTRLDVGLPHPIGQDQGDLRVIAEQLHRPVSASVVIGDDRVDMLADKIQSIAQDQRLVANPSDSDQEMLLRQKLRIARDHPLRVAQLPRSCACIDHHAGLTINPQSIMVESRDVGKRRARHAAMGVRKLPENARGKIDRNQLCGERSKGRPFGFYIPLACINLASPVGVSNGGDQPRFIKADGSATNEPDSRW